MSGLMNHFSDGAPLYGFVGLAVLVLLYVSADSFLLKASVGNAWTVGARDVPPEISPAAGRAHRALWNLLETAPAFLALAVAAAVYERANAWIASGVGLYLAGRLAYLPAYLSGVPWLRTMFWQAATLGIAAMLVGVLVS